MARSNPIACFAAFINAWDIVGIAWTLPGEAAGAQASDAELMMAYHNGDAAAFDTLYARHRAPMFRYLKRQLGNDASADELFQDVWIRVIDARATYEPRAKFTTWLYTIAHNRLMDHFRSAGRAKLVSIDEDDGNVIELFAASDEAPETSLTRKQLATRILSALDALPAEQREAFLLQQEGGLSVEEIGAVTGATRETAKSRLRYALAKLRRDLADLSRSMND